MINKPLIQKVILIVKKYNGERIPSGFFTELADIFSVSRERIRQIAKEVNIVQRYHGPFFCLEYGKEILRKTGGQRKFCTANCRDTFRYKQLQKRYCKVCGKEFTYKSYGAYKQRVTCSPKCHLTLFHQNLMKFLEGTKRYSKSKKGIKIHENN